jgi:hypothetical protein
MNLLVMELRHTSDVGGGGGKWMTEIETLERSLEMLTVKGTLV